MTVTPSPRGTPATDAGTVPNLRFSFADAPSLGLAGRKEGEDAVVSAEHRCQLRREPAIDASPFEEIRQLRSRDDAYLTCIIRNGPNGMPAYSSAQLSDRDLSARAKQAGAGHQTGVVYNRSDEVQRSIVKCI